MLMVVLALVKNKRLKAALALATVVVAAAEAAGMLT